MRAIAVTKATLATHKSEDVSPKYVEMIELPVPELHGGDVLVRPLYSLISGNVKAWASGNYRLSIPVLESMAPLIPGTGCLGVVDEVASDVYGVAPGQVVWTSSFVQSVKNDEDVPPNGLLMGLMPVAAKGASDVLMKHYMNGSWSERTRVPCSVVYPLKLSLDEPEPLLRVGMQIGAYAIALGALETAEMAFGDIVLVNGAYGSLGWRTCHLALAMGCRTLYCVGRDAQKLASLKEKLIGLTNVREDAIQVLTNGDLPEEGLNASVGVDFLGRTDVHEPTLECLTKGMAAGGTFVLAGGVTVPIPIPYDLLLVKRLKVAGSLMYRSEVPAKLIQLIHSGILKLYPLDNLEMIPFSEDAINQTILKSAEARQGFFIIDFGRGE